MTHTVAVVERGQDRDDNNGNGYEDCKQGFEVAEKEVSVQAALLDDLAFVVVD